LLLKWIEHKKAINKPIKFQTFLESFFSDLLRESENDLKIADAIMNHTMAGGWGTLVVPDSIKDLKKKQKNDTNRQNSRLLVGTRNYGVSTIQV